MLSQKIQDDLMSAYQQVHEGKRGHAAGDSDVEKQASQLASDVRYKAKGKVKDGASEEEKKKIFMQILGASPAPTAVKSMAKQKLLGEGKVEDYRKAGNLSREAISVGSNTKKGQDIMKKVNKMTKKMNEGSAYGITKGSGKPGGAMKKFLDAKAKKLQKEYDSQSKEKKNNPAFQSNKLNPKPVYNSHEPQGEVVSEKKKESNPKNLTLPKGVKSGVDYTKTGSSTAYMGEAKKAKKDYDGDGKVESGTQEFLGSRDKAIKKAIAKRRGRVKEGFSAWRIDLDFNEQVKK